MMAEPPRIWKQGERVDITYSGRVVTGRVELASKNGVSLMLAFEARLGGYVGLMPVIWNGVEYEDLIMGVRVAITEPATARERMPT